MNGDIIQILPAENLPFLAALYRWGIEVIRIIQGIESPSLTALVKFISALGTEAFVVPLLLLLFWCIDEKRGFRLTMLVIFSAWVNVSLKSLFKQPRPYNLEPQVGLAREPSYGFPSGHAQSTLTLWAPLSSWILAKKKKYAVPVRAGALLFVLIIGFTRLYLGVHFPTDLLGGWLAAGIILTLVYFLSPHITALLRAAGKRSQLMLTAGLALILNGLHPADSSMAGLFLGFGCGYSLMINAFPFSARGSINGKVPAFWMYAARWILGAAAAGGIYLGLKFLLPGEDSLFADIPGWGADSSFYELSRFIRYGLIGLWVSAGAPRIFLHLGIAGPGEPAGGAR
jgi:membrane-associated phospholipid phosphatase